MISNSSAKSPRVGSAAAWRGPCGGRPRRRRGSSRERRRCGRPRRTCARCGRGRCPARRTRARRGRPCGVSALARTPIRRNESAQVHEASAKSPDSSGLQHGDLAPSITWPVPPSMVRMSPFLKVTPPAVIVPRLVVNADRAGAGDAGLAHAARDDRRVRGHATRASSGCPPRRACRGCRPGSSRRGRGSPGLPASLHRLRVLGVEDDLAGGRAGRRRQADGNDLALGVGIDGGMQQLVEGRPGRCAAPPPDFEIRPSVRPCRRRCAAMPWWCACRSGSAASRALPSSTVNSMSCISR